jgi:Asp-tRNA(Asn)/Glu-tRNA(Gln) amidotransferase A subunit family amidase
LDATVGRDEADPATEILEGWTLPRFVESLDRAALDGLRIGVYTDLFGDAPEDAEVRQLVHAAVTTMTELGAESVAVEQADIAEGASSAGVIADEFKWDLMDYLTVSEAPVRSLEAMIDMGAIHDEVEPLMRRWNATSTRDSDGYQERLATRTRLRSAIEELMARESVDVLVYPTARQAPALIGERQSGENCGLAAHSGLPALSLPVGFTDDGLPIGMEILGAALDDARVLSVGFAFEQATRHRREPDTTPALSDSS